MFSLLRGLWRYLTQKDDYFVVIVGLDNAGKTTFLEQTKIFFNPGYRGMNLDRITTTVGLNVGTIHQSGLRINFWDLGGQADLRTLWDKYYSECHAVIYVVDSADPERMDESKECLEKMMRNEALNNVPLLLVANKQDKRGALSLTRINEIFDSKSQLIGRDYKAVQASALTGDGINDCISWLTDCMQRNSISRPPRSSPD